MNSLTHRLVALEVRRRLKEEMGISLPKKFLVWGSIRPDLVKHPVSHFKDERVGLFYAKWDQLCQMNPEDGLKEFCIELGEILHFLCDYFIYPHNEPSLMKEVWPHLKYENELHRYACKMKEQIFQMSYADYSLVSFQELIEYKHKVFMSKAPSLGNDLQSSFEICMIVVSKLFKQSAITLTYKAA